MRIQEKGKVGFKQSFKDFWKGYFDFTGQSTRAGFWWMQLCLAIIFIICAGIVAGGLYTLFAGNSNNPILLYVGVFAIGILSLAIFIPTLALSVRRLRDAGLNNISIIVLYVVIIITNFFDNNVTSFISTVLGLLMLVIYLLPSDCISRTKYIGRDQ